MAQTFSQLLAVPTLDTWRSNVISVLSGLGLVTHGGAGAGGVGSGTGSLKLSGTPTGDFDVVVKVSTTGEPGAAQYQVSTDGGNTFGAAATVPSSGAVAISTTGASMTFSAGAAGAGTSFVAGDTYSFHLASTTFATAQQPGSMGRALWEVDAQALQDLNALQAAIAAGGLLETSSGDWLTLLASNVYGLDRNQATVAKGTIVLTDAANAGPFALNAGDITVASTSGLRFVTTQGGTLAKGGTLQLSVQAESPGAAYDVANNTITSIVAGTLPGVTVNNPDAGGGTWLSSQGTDQESDAALKGRCSARWGALGSGGTADYYATVAKGASTNVTRVAVFADPTTPGKVDIYCAGPAGGSQAADVTAVNNAIQAKVPLTVTASVQAATNVPVNVTATVYYRGSLSAVQAAVNANVQAYIQGVALGTATGNVKAYVAGIIEAIMTAAGVVNTTVSAPAADVALTSGQVATVGTLSFTFTVLS